MPAEGAKPEEEKAVTEEAAVVHMPFFEKFKELQVRITNDFLDLTF
jgi:hypothetical protein